MNLTTLLDFESQHYHGAQTQSQSVNSAVANALSYFIQHFYQQLASSFVITISCRRPSPLNFYNGIMQQFFNTLNNLYFQLIYVNYTRSERVAGPRQFNLLLVDSLQAFLDIDVISYTRQYDTNEYYYIFLQQRDHLIPAEMESIFDYCWQNQLINCNVQTQNARGEIRMFTYFPYNIHECESVTPKLINEFVNGKWQHNDFFPAKLRDFHGCPLIVVVRVVPPFLEVTRRANESALQVDGFEGCLLKQLAQHLNFTMNVEIALTDERSDEMCCGAIARLENRTAHLGVGYYRKRQDMLINSTTTFPHHQNVLVASFLLDAHNLTTYEIFLYPFRISTWLTIAASFVFVLLGADLVYRCRAHGRSMRRILSSSNLIATALGLSLSEEPQLPNNRLLYISWVWATFLIRAMYSALLYYVFRNNVHQQLPETLTDLYSMNYQSVCNLYTWDEIQRIAYFTPERNTRRLVINSSNEFVAFPYLEQHLNERVFAVSSSAFLTRYVDLFHKPGMYRILNEAILTQQMTIYLTKHSFLIGQLDETLMFMTSVGLTEYCTRLRFGDKYFKSTHLLAQKFIELQDLHSIYVICGLLLAFAVLVFILELISKKCRLLRRVFQTI